VPAASRGGLDIFEACALGDAECVKALLESDGRLANAVAQDGFGPLGLACFFGHEPVARMLLASARASTRHRRTVCA
jgi:ankyrin repeat protein